MLLLVIVLVRGYQQTFLYQGGLVFVKNGSPRAATWSDVTGLEVLMFGEGSIFNGKTSAYLVKLSNGAPMRVGSSEIALPSPTPLTPSGLSGDGECWWIKSMCGKSLAVGSR